MKIKRFTQGTLAFVLIVLLANCRDEVKELNAPSVPKSVNDPSVGSTPPSVAQNCKKILVDASHDGGVWWFPQGEGGKFDPTKDHQGKTFAEVLRAKGFVVDELPRGIQISDQVLNDYHVIIRATGFSRYDDGELTAYQNALEKGIILFLVADFVDVGYSDNLADFLGVHFNGKYGGMVNRFSDHALVKGLSKFEYGVGSVINNPGENIQVIGWLENNLPVMGILDHPKSKIFLMGDGNSFETLAGSFPDNMTSWINQACASSGF
ncbi:MAG TPA: hypothetical protein VL728_07135 [Cyclobacteriaceae bacterium]|jgi:hypothetical protein|nr:hypothetical protein [Cyclobacteriaceae bacterium]